MSISQTQEGWWIIDGDTHISQWVKEARRLDHDQNSLPILYHYVRPGDFVMDIGANLGDHTIAYADWVGSEGHVVACECNPEALDCLRKNISKYRNVEIFPYAVHSHETTLYFEEQPNVGASFVSKMIKGQPVKAYSIDKMYLGQLDYLKIDAEGSEVDILMGGKETIIKHQPVLVIEVNRSALHRSGTTEEALFNFLRDIKYSWKSLFDGNRHSEQYDIIARYQGFKNL